MPPELTPDSAYWIFSSAAQSIAGLIGFLMAGVTLAFSMMDRLADEDDTLREVIQALKTRYHLGMSVLAIATGVAITASLLSLWVNPTPGVFRLWIQFLAAILDCIVIAGAIYFVILVASPARYARAAQAEYQKTVKAVSTGQAFEPDHVFFRDFVELERDIRKYLEKRQLYVASVGGARMSFSFRRMIEALYQNERITARLRDRLLEINKARNLLFHGHITRVDEKVIQDLRNTRTMWEQERGDDDTSTGTVSNPTQ